MAALVVVLTAVPAVRAETAPIGFGEFGPSATLIDFESYAWAGLEGRTIGLVRFSTFNGDTGSFGVEDAFGVFPPHSGLYQALKGDGWEGIPGHDGNWPPPIVAGTFSTPVWAVGVWITTPAGATFHVQDADGNDLVSAPIASNSGSNTYVGFSSTVGIGRVLIESNSTGGLGFDDFIYAAANPVPEPGYVIPLAASLAGITLRWRKRVTA